MCYDYYFGFIQQRMIKVMHVKLPKNMFSSIFSTTWHIATLSPSWNFSLAENLKSPDLQDGPQSGITFWIVTTHQTHTATRPTINIGDIFFSATTGQIIHKF